MVDTTTKFLQLLGFQMYWPMQERRSKTYRISGKGEVEIIKKVIMNEFKALTTRHAACKSERIKK